MPSIVPQSYSAMMQSCATSTRRRVRYPEFAVLSAVSARPLRAPCVEMKYWSTDRALAEVGGDRRLDDLARRLGHQAAHAGQLANLLGRTARARVGHDVDRVERRAARFSPVSSLIELLGADLAHHLFGDLLGDLRPDVDDLVVALAVGDETLGVLLLDLLHVLLRRLEQLASCAPGSACRRRRSRCRPWSRRCTRATAACRRGGPSPSGRRRGSSCRSDRRAASCP